MSAADQDFHSKWLETVQIKLRHGDELITHTTLMGFEGVFLSAYNNIFLEQAEKYGVLSKNAPNKWAERLHKIEPSRPQWDRETMSAWMLAGIVFMTPLDKCSGCGEKDIKSCSACQWARLCSRCSSHPTCSELKSCRRKLFPEV